MKFSRFFVPAVLLLLYACGNELRNPNVLFIISDDLTATAVSSYENIACKTPNIDRLAEEGVRYTRAYCNFPVCGPSRASMLNGYYPHATGTLCIIPACSFTSLINSSFSGFTFLIKKRLLAGKSL